MARGDISWLRPVAGWPLAEGEVHVWAFTLERSAADTKASDSVLSAAELERAARFRFERDRTRFAVGRAQLRHILGSYLQIPPGDLAFEYGPKGKPCLSATASGPALMFNLAHSEDLALLAVTRTGPVGVDVERIRSLPDADDLVSRFFSPAEAARFRAVPEPQRATAFFNLWTRKEAWLKATGEGIGCGLNQVEVTFLPGEAPRFVKLGESGDKIANWQLHEISPAPGFAGAVAIAAREVTIQCWQWNNQER